MNEQIRVYVNDKPVTIYRGMQVKHALIACDESLYKAAKEGTVRVIDKNGFPVGLKGALHPDAKIYTMNAKTKNAAGRISTPDKKGGLS
jgi:hypothetical protein